MKRTLFVIGGGIETLPGLERAKGMGLRVLVSDMNPNAPGFDLADDRLLLSTYDVMKTVSAAKKYHQEKYPIHGVICIATDVPLTVASVADSLGLPGVPVETAMLSMDKLAMKEKFLSDNVPVPWFADIDSHRDLSRVIVEKGYPLALKPVDSRGARGVFRLTEGVDLQWAFEKSKQYSPTGRVMVEEYLDGPQVSTESLIVDGKVFTLGFSDRNYEFLEKYAPNIIENGGELPSHLSEDIQARVKDIVVRAAKSMGITNGVAKGDIVIQDGRPYIIEIAARLSGGYFCSHEIPLNTGVDFLGAAIRLALGDKINDEDLIPRFQKGVAQRYLFPDPGRVLSIEGVEKAASHPQVALCDIRVQPGDLVGPVDAHPARAGVVITTGRDREEAVAFVEDVISMIHIQT